MDDIILNNKYYEGYENMKFNYLLALIICCVALISLTVCLDHDIGGTIDSIAYDELGIPSSERYSKILPICTMR